MSILIDNNFLKNVNKNINFCSSFSVKKNEGEAVKFSTLTTQ